MEKADQARIVVGVDGSAGSRKALAWAAERARLDWKTLVAVKVWEPVMLGLASSDSDRSRYLWTEAEQELRATLAQVLGQDHDVEVETRVLCGSPGRVLSHAAEDAAMLVVGRRGRHEWAGRLTSVSGYCARHATCPVVVVHH